MKISRKNASQANGCGVSFAMVDFIIKCRETARKWEFQKSMKKFVLKCERRGVCSVLVGGQAESEFIWKLCHDLQKSLFFIILSVFEFERPSDISNIRLIHVKFYDISQSKSYCQSYSYLAVPSAQEFVDHFFTFSTPGNLNTFSPQLRLLRGGKKRAKIFTFSFASVWKIQIKNLWEKCKKNARGTIFSVKNHILMN